MCVVHEKGLTSMDFTARTCYSYYLMELNTKFLSMNNKIVFTKSQLSYFLFKT